MSQLFIRQHLARFSSVRHRIDRLCKKLTGRAFKVDAPHRRCRPEQRWGRSLPRKSSPSARPPYNGSNISSAPSQKPHAIGLALQGGGAHGAFSWGVVDRLLDEPWLTFEGFSGTSAGAMNATLAAYGLIDGGRARAQDLLATFWQRVAQAGSLTPFRRSWVDKLNGGWSLDHSPWLAIMDVARQFVSPYQTNPLDLNPLRKLLEELIDFSALRQQDRVGLYIAATNVHTGQATVFPTREIDCHRVMASACLPFLFQAVEIDGVPYWDGGYLSNPPLFPLVDHGTCRDLVMVPINPCLRQETPRTARDIFNRLNEITFNASFNHELKTLQLINEMIDGKEFREGTRRRLYLHRIGDDSVMRQLNASSKINTEWDFLRYLHDIGHSAADHWLKTHRTALGRCDSIHLAPSAHEETSPPTRSPERAWENPLSILT